MSVVPSIRVDLSKFRSAVKSVKMKQKDLLDIEFAGKQVIVNGIRMRAPHDTGATANSTKQHIIKATDKEVVDDIGPETLYALYLEYGTGIYAEEGNGRKGGWRYKDARGNWHFTFGMRPQPFMRPTVKEDYAQVVNAITETYKKWLGARWP